MKEGDNSKTYGSIVIPKQDEFENLFFVSVLPKEREDTSAKFALHWTSGSSLVFFLMFLLLRSL